MEAWWTQLTTLNQIFYIVAIFFSVFFVWQLVAALVGLGGSEDLGGDSGVDAGDAGPGIDDTQEESVAAFKLLSIRSVIAFGMLFGWAGAFYLQAGHKVPNALAYALVWGAVGMFLVSYF